MIESTTYTKNLPKVLAAIYAGRTEAYASFLRSDKLRVKAYFIKRLMIRLYC